MDENKLLIPKIDVVFHALFRESNHKLLESMLSSILGTNVNIVEYLDRHLDIKDATEKLGVMDLRVRFEDGSYCAI
ncbi:MAG: PD-(D/E)XK nuclease family transposase, partial [Clostridia bacterium]|nr:PD-(D/E)XK nuclease family transposase [Clostridia bacterium]